VETRCAKPPLMAIVWVPRERGSASVNFVLEAIGVTPGNLSAYAAELATAGSVEGRRSKNLVCTDGFGSVSPELPGTRSDHLHHRRVYLSVMPAYNLKLCAKLGFFS
jgi:hypothetical protein